MLKIETTTSSDARETANKKLAKDATLEKINKRRALAREGIEKLDKKVVMLEGKSTKWVELKD